ncbi:hypothetical protein [Candidatus Poriferisodalis sp.]|uniref:hypothetical protein n=1 Tax=Candidatus Poriferisodalis sp. TaxID=3101277 RepID=UPI003AF90580
MDGRGVLDARAQSARWAPHETTTGGARPEDTSPEIWHRLTNTWESMTPAQRVALAAAMSAAIETSTRAGIRIDEPDADETRVRFLVAQRRYGTEVADAAFGADGRWPK